MHRRDQLLGGGGSGRGRDEGAVHRLGHPGAHTRTPLSPCFPSTATTAIQHCHFVHPVVNTPLLASLSQGLIGGYVYFEFRRRQAAPAAGAKAGDGTKSLSELVDMEIQGLDSSKP